MSRNAESASFELPCHPSTNFQATAPRLSGGITLTPALSHDGRGDKRAFDRLRPNVLPRGHTAVTDNLCTAPVAGRNAAQGERFPF